MQPVAKIYDVHYDPEIQSVVMEWNGYATSEQFRRGTELMLEILRQSGAQKVVGNVTDFVLIGREDQEWLLNDFLPQAVEHGFRKCGLTIPLYYFNKVAIETVISKITHKELSVKLFKNFAEAKAWIQE